MNDDEDGLDAAGPVDLTPLFGRPDPERLDRLARRISASVAASRAPRSVLEQLAAWAPAALVVAFALAALVWVPALVAPRPDPRDPATALLKLALSRPGPRGDRATWFKP
ncbi:MAG TPA: hypothetical protein VFA20_26630 [Myxococcaceae bacterium]|nr:hypothetical protein [Myxococcaceae bacterium]